MTPWWCDEGSEHFIRYLMHKYVVVDLSAHLRTSPHLNFIRLKCKVIMRLLPNRLPHDYGMRGCREKAGTQNPRSGHWLSVDVNIVEIG